MEYPHVVLDGNNGVYLLYYRAIIVTELVH